MEKGGAKRKRILLPFPESYPCVLLRLFPCSIEGFIFLYHAVNILNACSTVNALFDSFRLWCQCLFNPCCFTNTLLNIPYCPHLPHLFIKPLHHFPYFEDIIPNLW